MQDVSLIIQELELWALGFDVSAPEVGPWPMGIFIFQMGNAKLTIKSIMHPVFLRNRATLLQKQSKVKFGTPGAKLMASANRWKPSMVRPKTYSKQVAQKFLDDGERDNWEQYQGLFK